ncbi:MAG: hypothetical protein IPM57_05615 [Oligoflexia bacterium]|nr:hypothetical protein [Oligoflexia bacterium]
MKSTGKVPYSQIKKNIQKYLFNLKDNLEKLEISIQAILSVSHEKPTLKSIKKVKVWIKRNKFISASQIQRQFRFGYPLAVQIIKTLSESGLLRQCKKTFVYEVIKNK